jgi:hypothetical protein
MRLNRNFAKYESWSSNDMLSLRSKRHTQWCSALRFHNDPSLSENLHENLNRLTILWEVLWIWEPIGIGDGGRGLAFFFLRSLAKTYNSNSKLSPSMLLSLIHPPLKAIVTWKKNWNFSINIRAAHRSVDFFFTCVQNDSTMSSGYTLSLRGSNVGLPWDFGSILIG